MSRRRRTYTQMMSELDGLNALVDRLSTTSSEIRPQELVKALRSMDKGLRKVRVQAQKIGKQRASNSGITGVQSGFQKPVRISDAVAQFTGWDASAPRARVEVTNFVCDYIKQHNLQSPQDRRVILADERLSQLLDYQAERDGNLTYATIQKLLAKHYTAVASA